MTVDAPRLPDVVDEYLSANRSELVGFAETLIGYDTQNPPGRTTAAVEWLESTLEGTDLHCRRVEVDPEKPNLLATLPGSADRTLCFNGHLDRVGELDDGTGFYVEDDGAGIPADERDRVFEAGYTTSEDGTGFGLRIVEQIADSHGWDITVTDGESGGARFEFTGVDLENE